ncbi:hypothetical protein AVEN_245306-1 [Araneus ventricosus]|uniref:Secreted protein n=1 Tax=Araneus ventricosus TaxID=182803 RepID=A0A4Y2SYJ1_ARAVE|nr:hypothetical protein AVEN_245306-1 [Araneus ventricosus]
MALSIVRRLIACLALVTSLSSSNRSGYKRTPHPHTHPPLNQSSFERHYKLDLPTCTFTLPPAITFSYAQNGAVVAKTLLPRYLRRSQTHFP